MELGTFEKLDLSDHASVSHNIGNPEFSILSKTNSSTKILSFENENIYIFIWCYQFTEKGV